MFHVKLTLEDVMLIEEVRSMYPFMSVNDVVNAALLHYVHVYANGVQCNGDTP